MLEHDTAKLVLHNLPVDRRDPTALDGADRPASQFLPLKQ